MSGETGLRDLLYSKQWLDEVQSTLQPGDPALEVPEAGRVLAVITEITLSPGNVTQVVAGFANGNARLIYSNGGALLGDLSVFPEISESAKSLVSVGQEMFAGLATETEVAPMPPVDHVRFAVLTMGERRSALVAGPDVVQESHPLWRLFAGSNRLWEHLSELQEKVKQK